jgi:hypothetical protein
MYRPITVVAVTLLALLSISPALAHADDLNMPPGEHRTIGLGFHNDDAPVGVRWWMSGQKIGIDLGLGYSRSPAFLYADEHLMSFALDVGVPIVMKSWSRVHFMFRPGLLYQSSEVEVTAPPTPFDTETSKNLRISGELEVEAFLLDNFSVSASHGIAFDSFDPAGPGDKLTSFSTIGNNFTNIGFHVYLFGGGGH